MNYFIQGDAANADKIKAAFKAKGINTTAINVGEEDFLYFSFNGLLYFEDFSPILLKIFKTHPDYKELELSVEPKLKVGDWIVQNDNGTVSQITKVIKDIDKDGEYRAYEHTNGYFHEIFENEFHLWSIADAKDGDVLYFNDNTIVIFKDLYNSTTFHSYCYIEDGLFEISEDEMPDWWESKGFTPATKEQCDLLFAKMREAGYQWDADKKDVKSYSEPKVGG